MTFVELTETQLAFYHPGTMLEAIQNEDRYLEVLRPRPPRVMFDPPLPGIVEVERVVFTGQTLSFPYPLRWRGHRPQAWLWVRVWDCRRFDGKLRWDPSTVQVMGKLEGLR